MNNFERYGVIKVKLIFTVFVSKCFLVLETNHKLEEHKKKTNGRKCFLSKQIQFDWFHYFFSSLLFTSLSISTFAAITCIQWNNNGNVILSISLYASYRLLFPFLVHVDLVNIGISLIDSNQFRWLSIIYGTTWRKAKKNGNNSIWK